MCPAGTVAGSREGRGERMSKDWKPSDHIAVVLTKCEVYKGSGDVYVRFSKRKTLNQGYPAFLLWGA